MKNQRSVRRSRPIWNRKALSQAIALVTAGLQGPAAFAASCTITGGATQATTCALVNGESATINTGGAIIVPNDVAILLSGDGAKTVTNDGTVSGIPFAIAGQADGVVTINNTANGVISGSSSFGEFGESGGAGIWLTGSLAATSILNNSGVISGNAISTVFAPADGVILDGTLLGAVTNSGTISGNALSGFNASAGGLAVGAVGATGSITNEASGVIIAQAAAVFSFNDASAEGLAIGAVALGGTVTNSGTISGEAIAFDSKATGVVVGTNAGTITNNLNISAAAGLDGGESLNATAFGVDVVSNTGSIINSVTGAIHASAAAYDSTLGANVFATATGVHVEANSATITNNGEIAANAQALTEFNGGLAFARATGLNFGTIAETGIVVNDGIISAAASAFGDEEGIAVATGVSVGEIYGLLDNSGTIAAFASANSSSAIAGGLSIGSVGGTVANSGTISADAIATGFAFADAVGLSVGIGEGASVTNDGSITADASSQFAAQARGARISIDGGTFTNADTGSIEARANAAVAQATGLGTGSFALFSGGAVDNSGHISGSAFGSLANAAGVRLDAFDGLNGSLNNSGSISALADGGEGALAEGIVTDWIGDSGSIFNDGDVTATATAFFDATAAGIATYGGLSGDASITNALGGSVSAQASGSRASAYAIDIGSSVGVDASITNAGSVTATATATDSYAEANGVYVGGYFEGSLANSGSIAAIAGGPSDASAVGVLLDSTAADTATLSNSGTISGAATASLNAYAVGVAISADLDGTLDNSGAISATADGLDGAEAIGVYVDDDVNGLIDNSGTITATATATDGFDGAEAIGVWIAGDLDGDLVNSGGIEASATGTSFLNAIGIFAEDIDTQGTLTNTGTVRASVTGSGTNGQTSALGILVFDLQGTLDNRGTIEAEANGAERALAIGVSAAFVDVEGTIDNSGDISASAIAAGFLSGETVIDGVANAYGITTGTLAGTVDNSGSIEVGADGADFAWAVGISGGFIDVTGRVINDGAIEASATGENFGFASGIFYGDVVGDIDSSGSIDASASGFDGAEAYGIVAYYVDPPGSVTNRGDISASASASDEVNAAGIWSYEVDGTVENSGTIEAEAQGIYSASAFGVMVDNFLAPAGTVSNTGRIVVEASASGSTGEGFTFGYANAGGLTAGFIEGTLENNGAIDVTADGAEGAVAYGLGTIELGSLGRMLNDVDGLILVAATATEDAQAAGIGVLDGAEGSIENRGAIDVSASASSGASAAGIYVGNSLTESGSIGNSGSISANAQAGGGFDGAEAYGIFVENQVDGSIDNSGSIAASANASSFAEAFGIFIGSTLTDGASLTNSGSISAHASASFSAFAGGMVANWVDGTLSNSGDIEVGADGAESIAIGIGVFNALGENGTIVNSGGIDVFANGAGTTGEANFTANAVGVYVRFMNSGTTVTNTGTITADNGSGSGSGLAVWVDGGEGPVTPLVLNAGTLDGNVRLVGASMQNSGVLSLPTSTDVFADGSYISGDYTQSGAGVFEIDVQSDSVYGRMYVDGTADISGGGAFAVNVLPANSLAAGDVLDNVLTGGEGLVTGAMSVTDDSLLWDFTALNDGENGVDLTANAGVSPEDAVGASGPVWAMGAAGALGDVIYGGDADGDFADVIASLSLLGSAEDLSEATAQMVPLLVGQSAQAAALNLNSLGSIVTGRMDAHRAGVTTETGRDQNLWGRGFSQFGEQDEDSTYPGFEIDGNGMVIGYDQDFGGTWNVGAALAYSETDVKSDSTLIEHKIEAETYQGALYAYWTGSDGMYADMMAVFGSSENDSRRLIQFADVSRTATGEYDTTFMRFSGAFGKAYEISDSMTFTPVVDISYTTVEDDSYAETGAGDLSLSVDDSEVEALIVGIDGRLGVAVSDGVMFTTHAGVGYDTMTDDTTIAAAFVGGGPAFLTSAPEPDEMLIRAGASLELSPSSNMDFHVNYEYEYRDTFENNVVTGTLRWKF